MRCCVHILTTPDTLTLPFSLPLQLAVVFVSVFCVCAYFQNDVIIFVFLSRVVGVETVVFWKNIIM